MLAIISSRYQYGPFLFSVAEVMSNYLTTDGLKKNFSTSGGAPEARGICHICHMVNPALNASMGTSTTGSTGIDRLSLNSEVDAQQSPTLARPAAPLATGMTEISSVDITTKLAAMATALG